MSFILNNLAHTYVFENLTAYNKIAACDMKIII